MNEVRHRHGLMDTLLCLALAYAVYAQTPVGAIPVYVIRRFQDKPTPNLLATFRGRETAADTNALLPKTGFHAPKEIPPSVAAISKKSSVPPELLLTYLAYIEADCTNEACVVKSPPEYLGGKSVSLLKLALIWDQTAKTLQGDHELALEALYVPAPLVKRAVRQAEASHVADAAEIEAHAQFYSAGIRRGILQEAIGVAALHRLRTMAWPTDSELRISSPFGNRVHPVLGTKKLHNGTDIAGPIGTPIYAPHRAKVRRIGQDSVSGKWIKLDHGFDIETTYCHLSVVETEADAQLHQAQPIARMGKTGRVTGPHLHYILRLTDEPVDPQLYGYSPSP